MAIDIIQEKTYTLAALAKMHFWPVRRAGKKINVVTLWRWTEHGLNGIRLETILAGGCRVSSVEAVQRVFRGLNRPGRSRPRSNSRARQYDATAAQADRGGRKKLARPRRRKQIERAEEKLAQAGV